MYRNIKYDNVNFSVIKMKPVIQDNIEGIKVCLHQDQKNCGNLLLKTCSVPNDYKEVSEIYSSQNYYTSEWTKKGSMMSRLNDASDKNLRRFGRDLFTKPNNINKYTK